MSSSSLSCIIALLYLASLQCQIFAQSEALGGEGALSYRERIVGQDPMGCDALDARVARILRSYYAVSFGGEDVWEEIESFRFEGVLRMPEGALSFVAFKKKPDYCKVVLLGGNGVRIVMSYDGVDAWQLNTTESSEPAAMPPLEALNFIRDAPLAGYLLYPSVVGKQIELLGTRVVDGYTCYDLRVTLPDGQQITYAIDRLDFVERQQIVVNAVSGATEAIAHTRIEKIAGISIPMESTMTIDGEFVHSVRMRSVEVNQGLMPWMFARPSGASVPGGGSGVEQASDLGLVGDVSPNVGGSLILPDSFGFGEAPASAFGPSRFPNLDAETKQSILDDIGDL